MDKNDDIANLKLLRKSNPGSKSFSYNPFKFPRVLQIG
jgi:hypothetical protein